MMTRKQMFSLTVVVSLLIALVVGLSLVSRSQERRTMASSSSANLFLYPNTEGFNNFSVGETKLIELQATFTNGSPAEKLDYFRTEISFSPQYLAMSDDQYIDTAASGFSKIFRVDGPTVANQNGKIVIEIGAGTPGSGPATDKPFTLAKIYFKGISQTPSVQNITIGKTQVINNQHASIPATVQKARYTVTQSVDTPTPTCIPRRLCLDAEIPCTMLPPIGGWWCPKPIPSITPTQTPTPIPSPTATPTITPIPLPTATPSPTVVPTLTSTPIPTSTQTPTPTIELILPTETPTPTETPIPLACLGKNEGDANCDGLLDGIDYSIWLNNQCNPTNEQICRDYRADFNNDEKVNDDDFGIWFRNSRSN